jgi:type III secretion system FlhB-like substrate exporter
MSEVPYITILSHGTYTILEKTFIVPKNIILWQYSTPGQILSLIEAMYIIKQGGKIANPFYLIDRESGEKYGSFYKAFSIKPGEETKDLRLDFTINEFEGIQMGIQSSTGYLEIPIEQKTMLLSELLNKISSNIPENSVVPVIQLSCRSGNYISTTPDYKELIRAIESCKIKNDVDNLLYLKRSHIDAFNPKYYFLTEDAEVCDILSCLIERNFPLHYFETTEEIIKFINSQQPKQGGNSKKKTGKHKIVNKKQKTKTVKTKKNKNKNKN